MSIKLTFEIGHSASRKTKPSKEGFTHDWELFVRGSDGNDIGHFVDKVVFNLHESFPKPKRVIKEPPYTVKEAGYAGFVLKIDIYLKNRDEPKKVTFDYDLDLQPIKTQSNEITISNPADDFRRKCLKGGGVILPPGDYKSRDSYGKGLPMPPQPEIKKSSKRPEETKPNKIFTDLFGAPLKKPDPRAIQNSSPNPTKLPAATTTTKGIEKASTSSSVSGSKEKSEKSKHKHSPNKDGKEVKKEAEKPKKDKTKDRERSEKKEKISKRPSSPSPNSMPGSTSSSSVRNSTNSTALPASKNDSNKPPVTKQSSTPVPGSGDSSFNKKSSKKDKKSHDKERERNEKKESRAKEAFSSKEKSHFESVTKATNSNSAGSVKERDPNRDDRDKAKIAKTEPKTTPIEPTKKQHDKHKHKKKEKSKETGRDSGSSSKKEKQHKNSTTNASPAKAKEQIAVKYEPPKNLSEKDSSDSDVDSPPSIKQDSDNSIADPIVQKPPPEIEKTQKKPRERTKAPEKEEKTKKRKKKEDRDSSASPPAAKQARKEVSKSPSIQERPSSSDSAAHHSHMNNNNNENSSGDRKISNEYMSELKDLKQKITTLKSNDELQQVVRLIAATGCYEITKSSFDFDLVQLDRGTVQRLQEFFASS